MEDTSTLKFEFLAKGLTIVGKSWKSRGEEEPYAKLYYVVSGEASFWSRGQEFFLRPRRLYLIPPQSIVRYRCEKSCEIAWVHFNILVYGHLDLFKLHGFSLVYLPENHEVVNAKMRELISLLDQEDIFSQLRSKSLLLELVSPLFKFQSQNVRSLNENKIARLTPVLNHIDTHLGEQIKLEKLAKLAAYEKTYFSTFFKQVFSTSPIAYIQNKRIEKAKSILRNTNMKIEAVAKKLGFNDAFHFSKTFKKITGEPPGEFRRRISKVTP